MLSPMRRLTAVLLLMGIVLGAAGCAPATRHRWAGADISALLDYERSGAVYRDPNHPADALAILRQAGCNLFRVRLFVDPETDRAKAHGATQNIADVTTLGRRIRQSGAAMMLDLHYSDTWADPKQQTTPRAWKDLTPAQLEARVEHYTRDVIQSLQQAGAGPDLVQIGNEIAPGMLWPTGRIPSASDPNYDAQWNQFARLLRAASRGVRTAQPANAPIQIVVHIHGGGDAGVPPWFFKRLTQYNLDYDVVGLSFYPIWHDTLPALQRNLDIVAQITGKPILICETSYPYRPLPDKTSPALRWPLTPEGQVQFCSALDHVLRDVPAHRGAGAIWWHAESIPHNHQRVYHWGYEALFDHDGRPLPAMRAFFRIAQ